MIFSPHLIRRESDVPKIRNLTSSNPGNRYTRYIQLTWCLALYESQTTSSELLSESLPSFLSWQDRTMLLIDTRGNPLLIEAFTLKIVETSTQQPLENCMYIHVQEIYIPLKFV